MTKVTESYLKVPYDLRPAKQVERRMIVDALQIMSRENFKIADYQYTGFGSVYFVDFILVHRLLGIHDMLSVEKSESIKKRIMFNRPFFNIRLQFKPASEIIPELNPDKKHILWLDYDDFLNHEILSDVTSAATQLSCGSILLITVDIEPPINNGTPKEWMQYFKEQAKHYFNPGWKQNAFSRSNLKKINGDLIYNAIKHGIAGRTGVEFFLTFNFNYKDGHNMLTLGGVIGLSPERRMLKACDFDKASYIRRTISESSYEIYVPRLTRKERFYLDAAMPCADGWRPGDFELTDEYVKAYREIYRFYPSYAELLL